MNNRILKSSKGLPAQRGRLVLQASRQTKTNVRPAPQNPPTQIAVAHEKSVRFMKEIWHRAQAPFRSSAPGPDHQPEPVYPPVLSRL